jgi:tRNA threonylcarbamoyl adenosine modification protein YeaZ
VAVTIEISHNACMILAINTAQHAHELALIDGDELLAEEIWPGSRDDIERLVPTLESMLEDLGLDRKEITDVLVVHGPGPYTAVRMGVSFANGIAEGLGAQLHSLSTFDCMIRKVASPDKVLALLFAGGMHAALHFDGETKIDSLSTLLAEHAHENTKVVAELNETQSIELHSICLEKGWEEIKGHELQSLGEVILTDGLSIATPVDLVKDVYLRAPKITASSNPWKKA